MNKVTGIKYFSKDFYRAVLIIWKADQVVAVANIALQFFQAVLPVVSLYFIKMLVELLAGVNKVGLEKLVPVVVGFCVIQFLLAVAGQFSGYLNTLQQQKITDYVSSLVLAKAVEVELEYYENPEYHDSLHLAQLQSQYRIPQLVTNINALLLNSLSLVFLFGFFFTLQWMYALLFLLLSMPLAAIKWYYSYQLYRLEKKFVPMERESNYYHEMLTRVSYAKEVRAFGFADTFIAKFKNIRADIYDGKKQLNIKLNRYSLLTQAGELIVMVFIFVMLAKHAWAGSITLGVFVIYIQGFQRLQGASRNFLQSFVLIFQQRLFLRDLFQFFDIQPKSAPANKQFPSVINQLAVDNLSFTYPQTTKPVLHQVSLVCRPGKVIAIVGENGSGKSTLVKLLARMYTIQQGTITIDDSDMASISDDAFRANTFFLFQDFEKFFLTIEDNITLAGGSKDKPGIQAAAALAGADEFIGQLSDGYKTRLGRTFERSEQLSGGQWQKLALARMFYKNAQMIVLDEPTSSIDAIAEYELYKNLRQYAAGKIVILISHRLYNLKIADHIYVMKDGRIAEEGGFDQLISNGGIFKQLYDNQKL